MRNQMKVMVYIRHMRAHLAVIASYLTTTASMNCSKDFTTLCGSKGGSQKGETRHGQG